MKHWFKYIITSIIAAFTLLSACSSSKKNTEVKTVEVEYHGNLFLDIYANILDPNCNIPACHDGSFEPNFTSPQSAYYTTVKHKLTKNNWNNSFEYRIAPNDTAQSLLYERITNCCFINESDRMPVLMQPLSQSQIDSIAHWIMLGAPNWDGEFTYENIKQ